MSTKTASKQTPEMWAEKIVGTLISSDEPGCIPRIAAELAHLKRSHAALVEALEYMIGRAEFVNKQTRAKHFDDAELGRARAALALARGEQ